MKPLSDFANATAPPPDEELVVQVLGGCREAYADLVRRYERAAHAAAWAILRDHHSAQDVTQDAFVKAYNGLGELRTPRTFGAWLLTIVRRLAIDSARSPRRLVYVPSVPEAAIPTPAEEDAATLLEAAANLPAHEQQVLLLRYFDGLAVAEIAARLGSPVGTVTKQLSRALTRLRGFLKETP